jgi:hypothetical protein
MTFVFHTAFGPIANAVSSNETMVKKMVRKLKYHLVPPLSCLDLPLASTKLLRRILQTLS